MTAFPIEGEALRVEALPHGVKRLVLNRPRVGNAFDGAMARELTLTLAALAAIPRFEEMRVLVLEGEGASFCAGADLAHMKEQGEGSMELNLEGARELGLMFSRLSLFPAPVVACVHGAAIGGGLGLAACCDFVLADPEAVFATSEVRLGLVPAVISPYLVRRIGLAAASALMLAGRRIRAPEALGLGLVQRLIETSRDESLDRVLREFLAAGPRAARVTKELLRACSPLPDPELAAFTQRSIAMARQSAEGQAGLRAFFQKVPPPWAPPEGKD